MRLRHALVSLGLAGALLTGTAAFANAVTSDSIVQAITIGSGPTTHRSSQPDETWTHHLDNNIDDRAPVSLTGLEAEIEVPKDLVEPIEPTSVPSQRFGQ
jgi:hypothetical protein